MVICPVCSTWNTALWKLHTAYLNNSVYVLYSGFNSGLEGSTIFASAYLVGCCVLCFTAVIFCLSLQHVPNLVTSIHTIGQRVIVSDIQESLFWVRYKRNENQLIIFADDTNPRWVTTACLLDYDTMAAADKFGNISIVSAFSISCYV